MNPYWKTLRRVRPTIDNAYATSVCPAPCSLCFGFVASRLRDGKAQIQTSNSIYLERLVGSFFSGLPELVVFLLGWANSKKQTQIRKPPKGLRVSIHDPTKNRIQEQFPPVSKQDLAKNMVPDHRCPFRVNRWP